MGPRLFDDFQAELATDRSEFYWAVASGPFYGYNKAPEKSSNPVITPCAWTRTAQLSRHACAARPFGEVLKSCLGARTFEAADAVEDEEVPDLETSRE